MSDTTPVLFVDAYDSFTNNIVALCYSCIPSADIKIVSIDTDIQVRFGISLETYVRGFSAIILGPGPGDPREISDIGLFKDILTIASECEIPVLGICLGFQVLCLKYGCNIVRMKLPSHGQPKVIRTTGVDIFQGIPGSSQFSAINYNSLAIRTCDFVGRHELLRLDQSSPDCSSVSEASLATNEENVQRLELLACDYDGFAMAVRHHTLPLWGLQFHPESCRSTSGEQILRNWWQQVRKYNASRGRIQNMCPANSTPSSNVEEVPTKTTVNDQIPLSPLTLGRVAWTVVHASAITSQRLSSLCFEMTKGAPVAMLESTAKGRYCIYGFTETDSEVLEYSTGILRSRRGDILQSEEPVPPHQALNIIENRTKMSSSTDGCSDIPFWGGWIGFLSYEMGLDLLKVSSNRSRNVPDFSFVFVERSMVLDQRTGNIYIQSIRPKDRDWILQIQDQVSKLSTMNQSFRSDKNISYLQHILADAKFAIPHEDEYKTLFTHCDDHLHAGNSYELCLTCEARIDIGCPKVETSFDLYRNLNKHNPVPFASYLHFPADAANCSGTTILSTSPEQFLSCSRNGTLDMIPMKGTVQRTPTTTLQDAYRILASPKEAAENLMIADLIRHDLYSIVGCRAYPLHTQTSHPNKIVACHYRGDLTPPSLENDIHDPHAPEDLAPHTIRSPLSILALNSVGTFETVYQLVSHIRAHPPPTLDVSNPHAVIEHNHSALHHVLPPGSMTGAPKKRSCEILQQLENRNRGVYSGIIGYMDVGGSSCWSVAIRTAWSSASEDYIADTSLPTGKDGVKSDDVDTSGSRRRKIWHVGAGGAITVLSELDGEWQEMMGKMRNVLNGFRKVKEEHPIWRSA